MKKQLAFLRSWSPASYSARPARLGSVLSVSLLFVFCCSQACAGPVLLPQAAGQSAINDESLDPFFRELSPIDVETRLGEPLGNRTIDEGKRLLKERFARAVLDWPPEAAERVRQACAQVAAEAQVQCPSFIPQSWWFVLTSGEEEGAAAYTRGDTIVLPVQKVLGPGGSDPRRAAYLVAHETCHVYGRLHPATRARLLERLGFRVVGPIRLGAGLEPRKLTNPDSPSIDSVIRVRFEGNVEVESALVLYAEPDRFSPVLGGSVFRYLKYGLVAVADVGNGRYEVVGSAQGLPRVYSPQEVAGFFEQVGRNTRYIVSPDEILAENVAIALTRSPATDDPRLPADLVEIIRTSTEAAIAPDPADRRAQ